jgi:hypothetical protein
MEINLNSSAVGKISTALIKIWESDKLRRLCFEILESATTESQKKLKIYQAIQDDPYRTLVWIYFSLNSKGGVNGTRNLWCTNDANFKEVTDLITPEILYQNFNGDQEKIFYAINLIMRYYAGGRYLTVAKKYYSTEYEEVKKLPILNQSHLQILVSKIKINSQALSETIKNKSKTSSYELFSLFKKCHFNSKIINTQYNGYNLINSSIDQIGHLNGIGNKYSRNIKMDLRTTDVENHIAIDDRIQNILKSSGIIDFDGINRKKYLDLESFLIKRVIESEAISKLEVSYSNRPLKLSSMTAWEFDRLLFGLSDPKNNILTPFLKNTN